MTRNSLASWRLLLLLAIPFCVMTGTGMMFPLLAALAGRDGTGQSGAGILLSAFAVARLASNMPAGVAADRFGRRVVVTVGLAVLALGSIGAFLARGLIPTASCVLLLGAGSSATLTALLAALTDHAPPGQRGEMMSRYQIAVLIGISAGPITGGMLSDRFGLETPFLLQGLMATLAALMTWPAIAPGRPESSSVNSGPTGAIRASLTIGFAALAVLTFTLFMTRTATSWQIVPLIGRDRFGMDHQRIGVLLTAGALASLVAQPAVGRLIDTFGSVATIMAGSIGLIAAFLMMGLGEGAHWLWTGVIVTGLASSLLSPSLNSLAVETSRAGYGAAIGALRTAGDAGLVLGPLILGPLAAILGASNESAVLLAAGAMTISTAAFYAVHGRALLRRD